MRTRPVLVTQIFIWALIAGGGVMFGTDIVEILGGRLVPPWHLVADSSPILIGLMGSIFLREIKDLRKTIGELNRAPHDAGI